jgi:hypothetical protein
MGATKKKLDEAQFFFQEMEANCFKHPTFDYYLSAFISAARSVLWVMRNEFDGAVEWRAWYDSKTPDSEVAALLDGLNQLRVRTVKLKSSEVRYQLEIKIPKPGVTRELVEFFETHPERKMSVTFESVDVQTETIVSAQQASFPCKVESLFPVVSEFPDTNIMDICRHYVSWLSDLVCECETRFRAS